MRQGGGCGACGNQLASNARYVSVVDASGQASGCGWSCNAGYHFVASGGAGNSSSASQSTSASGGVQLAGAPGTCVGGTVWYAGAQYATLDGIDPLSLTVGGQTGWAQVPDGWLLAPDTGQSRAVIGKYPFGAQYVFVSDASAFYTSLSGSSAGQEVWGYSSFYMRAGSFASFGNVLYARILIVSQNCDVGYYWTGSNGTCNQCTNKIPTGAVYVSSASVSSCSWTCAAGFFLSSGVCALCTNNKPQQASFIYSGTNSVSDSCQWQCTAPGYYRQNDRCILCNNTLPSNALYVSDEQALTPCSWKCSPGYHLVLDETTSFNQSSKQVLGQTYGACVGGTVWYAGAQYATLDGIDPLSLTVGGQTGWAQVPDGWLLAPDTGQSRAVIGKYPFGAQYVFVSDGAAYYTSLEGGSAGQWAWGDSSFLMSTQQGVALGNRYISSESRILIVSQLCYVGFYGENGTCSVCSNYKPSTAHYVSSSFSNNCQWDCSPGYFVFGNVCRACSNLLVPFAHYSTAGIPLGTDNCQWECNVGFFKLVDSCSPCINSIPADAIYTSSGDVTTNDCAWACNVGFHLEQGTCTGGRVELGGRLYATLDGADPMGSSSGCQETFLPLPDLWELAPDNPSSVLVISSYPWSTDFLVVQDGSAYYTGRDPTNRGAAPWWQFSTLVTNASMFKPAACNGRILIMKSECEVGYLTSPDGCKVCNTSECGSGYFRVPCSQGTAFMIESLHLV